VPEHPSHPTWPGEVIELGRYTTPDGVRVLEAVKIPGRPHWHLLDSHPDTREDARCVEPSVDGIDQAEAIAADYLPRAERHGGPLTRAAAPPLPEPQSALF
jgi:hypothetical protein